MLSTGKIVIVVLTFAFASVTMVNAACVERPETNSTHTAMDKVSDFFSDVGCTIKSGAGRVKDSVENGFNYIKSKITPDDAEHPLTESQTMPTDLGDRMERLTSSRVHEDVMRSKRYLTSDSALFAPEMCAAGQVMIDGKCRAIVDF